MFDEYQEAVCGMYSHKLQNIVHAFHSVAPKYTGAVRERLESRNCNNIFAYGAMFVAWPKADEVLAVTESGEVTVTDEGRFLEISPASHLRNMQILDDWARNWLREAEVQSVAM